MIYFLLFIIIFAHVSQSLGYGFDSGSTTACNKPHRTARAREPPCDLRRQGWCVIAGAAYPWHAVRRFVRENQGLMRRMYGEERHISVLRAELMDSDLEEVYYRYSDPEKAKYKSGHKNRFSKGGETGRLLNHNDALLSTKFIYSEEPNLRTNELYTLPHFRQTSTTEINSFIENNTILEPVNKSSESNSVYMNFTITFAREETNKTTEHAETQNNTETEAEVTTEEEQATTTDSITTFNDASTTPTPNSAKMPNSTPQNTEQLFQDSEQDEKLIYKRRGVNACPVKEEVVAPFWANNTRGEVLALLNFYPFEQYVHWEKCTFEHRQMYCREGCRCEQQYRLHRLLAYDPNNECRGIFSDWFKFPSCCVCKCYDMPVEFRVTSRSPRTKQSPVGTAPEWYRRKTNRKNYQDV